MNSSQGFMMAIAIPIKLVLQTMMLSWLIILKTVEQAEIIMNMMI
jgi:hypothetical protein